MQKVKPKWLALRGVAAFDDGVIRQDGPAEVKRPKNAKAAAATNEEEGGEDNRSPVVLRSDVIFEDGEISCEVWLEHASSKVQFRLGAVDKFVTFAGINLSGGAYGIAQRDSTGKAAKIAVRDIASPDTPPPLHKWIPLQIKRARLASGTPRGRNPHS
jgi:hypothetical protein